MRKRLERGSRWQAPVIIAAVLAGLAGALSAGAAADPAPADDRRLPKLHVVSDGIYRGAQPERGGLQALADLGIRTIVNLRADDDDVSRERAGAKELGLRFVHIPLAGAGRPADDAMRDALAAIAAPEHRPVFVHCRRGSDRTGAVIACYRITHQGWSVDRALAEAKELGMGFWQYGLKRYIRDGCGVAAGAPPGEP